MSTLTVYAATTDGMLSSESETYSTARAMTGCTVATASSVVECGQLYYTPDSEVYYYDCWELFERFDTSSIPDTDTVSSATYSSYLHTDYSTTDYTDEVRLSTWTVALDSTDAVAGANLGSLTLLASIGTSGIGAAGYKAFTSEAAFVTNVSKTGDTVIMRASSRQRGNNAPTGSEYCRWYQADQAGTTNDPKLVVEHAAGGGATALTAAASNAAGAASTLALTRRISASLSRGAATSAASTLSLLRRVPLSLSPMNAGATAGAATLSKQAKPLTAAVSGSIATSGTLLLLRTARAPPAAADATAAADTLALLRRISLSASSAGATAASDAASLSKQNKPLTASVAEAAAAANTATLSTVSAAVQLTASNANASSGSSAATMFRTISAAASLAEATATASAPTLTKPNAPVPLPAAATASAQTPTTRYRYIIGGTANASSAAQTAALQKVGGNVQLTAMVISATAASGTPQTRYSYKVGGTANATAVMQPLYLTPPTAASTGVASAVATASAPDLWQREYVENANATASLNSAELSKDRHLTFDVASATAGSTATIARLSPIEATSAAATASASLAVLANHPSVVPTASVASAQAWASLAALTLISERVTYSVAANPASASATASTLTLAKVTGPLAMDATATANVAALGRLVPIEASPADASAQASGSIHTLHIVTASIASATAAARAAYISCPILFTARADGLATMTAAHLRRLLRSGKVKHTSNLHNGTLSTIDLTASKSTTVIAGTSAPASFDEDSFSAAFTTTASGTRGTTMRHPSLRQETMRRTRVGGKTWQSL